jgi:hypothetical protein
MSADLWHPVTREQAATEAVRLAFAATTVPHAYTRTVPHPRHIFDIGLAQCGIELTRDEIAAAVAAEMAR